jgi:hypothetical protein
VRAQGERMVVAALAQWQWPPPLVAHLPATRGTAAAAGHINQSKPEAGFCAQHSPRALGLLDSGFLLLLLLLITSHSHSASPTHRRPPTQRGAQEQIDPASRPRHATDRAACLPACLRGDHVAPGGGVGPAGNKGASMASNNGGAMQEPLLPKAPKSGGWLWKGTRPSASGDLPSSKAVLRPPRHVPALLCTLIVALGPVQFGFTSGYSSPTQDAVIRDLNLSISEVLSSRSAFSSRLNFKSNE